MLHVGVVLRYSWRIAFGFWWNMINVVFMINVVLVSCDASVARKLVIDAWCLWFLIIYDAFRAVPFVLQVFAKTWSSGWCRRWAQSDISPCFHGRLDFGPTFLMRYNQIIVMIFMCWMLLRIYSAVLLGNLIKFMSCRWRLRFLMKYDKELALCPVCWAKWSSCDRVGGSLSGPTLLMKYDKRCAVCLVLQVFELAIGSWCLSFLMIYHTGCRVRLLPHVVVWFCSRSGGGWNMMSDQLLGLNAFTRTW